MKNMTQEQYDRLKARCTQGRNVKALLEAYEEACSLLDRLIGQFEADKDVVGEAENFLYDENGEERVKFS